MQPRIEDILPVWSENTGMYETGYYATDAYHKSKFKQFALQLQAYRKIYLLEYVSNPTSLWNQNTYKLL